MPSHQVQQASFMREERMQARPAPAVAARRWCMVFNAFTTLTAGNARWFCSPSESVFETTGTADDTSAELTPQPPILAGECPFF